MLHINRLTVSYGNTKILNEINLTIEKGDSLALIGESGTGKTTLGKSIMGMLDAHCTGEINFNGVNLIDISEKEMAAIRWNKISMVFQNIEDALNPLYTVFDQVMEPMVEHSILTKADARKRAAELLTQVGIKSHMFSYYPHQLSGGQKQRVLIAMALANDPEILILDEPTSALDPLTKAEIIELLYRIGQNRSMIIVTHDFSTAAKLAKKTAVLYGGRIIEHGSTEMVLHEPKHPYTRGLLRSYPNMTTTKDLQGIPGRFSRPEMGCPFEPRCTQKIPKCREAVPELLNIKGHSVACHLGGIVPLLTVNQLSKSFDNYKVLDKINFTLYEGETIAVVGESGSGKTTLARTVMGLFENTEGDIFISGVRVEKREKDFFRQVQMIYQNPSESISHRFNVLQAVREPLDLHKIGDMDERLEKVKNVLEEVELPSGDEFLNDYPHHLSGGEAQRVAIARALILEPKILIADEPTSALDPSVQAKILKLLLNLQEKRGLSIILITHDIALARKVSDRLIVLREGKIIEDGPTYQVLSRPKSTYTKALLEAAPALDAGSHLKLPELKCSSA